MSASDRYAVFGNPVAHSKSPQIHAAFALQTGQDISYRAVKVDEAGFAEAAEAFFSGGGRGLNVTVPFKGDAWEFAGVRSPGADRARAVNTLSIDQGGLVRGDNTDGIGLVRDMVANLGWTIAGQRVLLLGAGGAARGVLELLLREKPSGLLVVNRTPQRARDLAAEFADLGAVAGDGFEAMSDGEFDLVINATSASLSGELPPLPEGLLSERGCCYDMMYGAGPTVFMRWAALHAAWAVADGLGMLVEQAAESFYLWRRERPRTAPVIAELRAALDAAG
jgi:shikimate dehydrogenase